MCFRPANAAKPIECPNCGMKIPVVGGVKQKVCPKCKTDLTQVNENAEGEETPQK
ncbi:MAG: hypothetical protein GX958_04985 [Desulfitobacterium sp.]|nr:hypothetical protein [Desulfitobacterium sp.]